MNTLFVILPIARDALNLVESSPQLKASVEYAGGLKSLAEYCYHCRDDWDLYLYGVSELLFSKLDAADIDPRQEAFHRSTIEKFALSDFFVLFLQNFFDQHKDLYTQLVGEATRAQYVDSKAHITRRSDAIALFLSR